MNTSLAGYDSWKTEIPEYDQHLSDMIGDLEELREQLSVLGDEYEKSVDSCDDEENCTVCAFKLAEYSTMDTKIDLMEIEIKKYEAGPECREDIEF